MYRSYLSQILSGPLCKNCILKRDNCVAALRHVRNGTKPSFSTKVSQDTTLSSLKIGKQLKLPFRESIQAAKINTQVCSKFSKLFCSKQADACTSSRPFLDLVWFKDILAYVSPISHNRRQVLRSSRRGLQQHQNLSLWSTERGWKPQQNLLLLNCRPRSRLSHHKVNPDQHQASSLLPESPVSPQGCSAFLRVGAFVIGFTIFTYGTHKLFNREDILKTLSNFLVQPVHARSDFQKNNFIADVVEKAGPAVVFLEIKGRHPLTGRPVTLSNGSGFIVRSNGIILTNAHVVANKSAVSVKLQDGRVLEGQVTAVDPISDLAAVKIPASGLPTIPLGNSVDIRPGEWVIAMGSPLSLSNTVTCGIVSSVQRASKELGLRNKNMDYIQTDAVINFGNSGGPLVNLDGKAIGINTMKVTTGISFAIPSDYAVKFLTKAEALMKNGKTENGFLKRRYMGITMLTLTESVMRDLRSNIKMPNFADVKGGVFVYKVIPGTPAHLGGILAGDIIIEISGVPIRSAADVYDAVEKGDHLTVTVIRGSETKNITINTQETI